MNVDTIAMNSDRNERNPNIAHIYSRRVKESSSPIFRKIFPFEIGESRSPIDAEKLATATNAAM
ncbi:hypothetical protein GCM10008966_18730 [Rhodovulum strictum]